MRRLQPNNKGQEQPRAAQPSLPLAVWVIITLAVSIFIYGAIAVIGIVYSSSPVSTAPPTPQSSLATPYLPTAVPVAAAALPTIAPPTSTTLSSTGLAPSFTPSFSPAFTATLTFTSTPTYTNFPSATFTPTNAAPSPTFTPPNTSPAQDTVAPTFTWTPSPTTELTATPSATFQRPTPRPTDAGLSFDNARLQSGADELLIFGNLVNNTGVARKILHITGTFYDAQGQVVADDSDLTDYWASDVVPADGRMPFQLVVDGIQNVASYNLRAETQLSNDPPRTDFEFLAARQQNRQNAYCVSADLQNSGNDLEDYLVIAAVLYDNQNTVVNFGDWFESSPSGIVGEDTYTFEICVNSPNAGAARYELLAWGR
ncbi:MAG: hypothetical protein HYZ49_02260 [Chloroflexi bacterium]|nr:hypothetical protein [Chloroflexota bacterium]